MIQAKRLPNGNILAPARAEGEGMVGDGLVELKAGTPEFAEWDEFLGRRPDEDRPAGEGGEKE